MIEVYKNNYRQEKAAPAFYEVQNIFHNEDTPKLHLGVIIDDTYQESEEPTLKLKKMAEEIMGTSITFKETTNSSFNPYNSAEIYIGDTKVGVIGELHPKVLREHKFIRIDKVKARLYYLELNIDSLNNI